MAARKSAGRVTIATVQRHHDRRAQGADAAAAVPVKPATLPKASGIAADGATAPISASPAPMRRRLEGADAGRAADGAPASPPREDRGGRPPRERFAGQGQGQTGRRASLRTKGKPPGKFGGGAAGDRDKGGRDKGGFGDKGGRDSGPSHRQYATSAAPRERDRPVDPNSPFAKLAALKEQLAGNRKD